ncbi:hypothetical protein WDU94_011535 [Cyamophila willieti]
MELPGLQHNGGHQMDLSHQLQHHQQMMHHSLMDDSVDSGGMNSEGPTLVTLYDLFIEIKSAPHGVRCPVIPSAMAATTPDMHVTLVEHEVHS